MAAAAAAADVEDELLLAVDDLDVDVGDESDVWGHDDVVSVP